MNKNPNVLLIAYTFPPLPYGGTYRSLRMCKRFDEAGINLHVLTIDIYDDIPNDFRLLDQVPDSINIHRTSIVDPVRRYNSKKEALMKIPLFKYVNKIISFFLRFVSIPDHMVLWNITAIPAAIRIVDKYKIDSVIVSSPPDSTLLIGYALKKIRKVKWISDLRDPIVGNVAAVDLITKNDIFTQLLRKILTRFNRLVIGNSDATIANTKTHLAELKNDFPTKNITTVRNSYDEDDFSGFADLKFEKFTIAHLGSYYGLRDANLLFKAIKKLEEKLAPEALNLQVLFYGLSNAKLLEDIKKYGVERYVKVKDIVSHQKAIQIMRSSHLLLLLKAVGKEALGQIPGKFFEYAGSKRKILCIGPKESEVAEIIQELDLGYTIEKNEKEAYQILEKNYSKFLEGGLLENQDVDLTQFSSNVMAEKIFQVIESA